MTPERNAELKARLAQQFPFSLPPGISVQKQPRKDGWAYIFRHRQLGELGQLHLRSRPDGQSHIMTMVAGDPDDPMTEQRAALLKPLADDLTQCMEQVLTGKTTPPGITERPRPLEATPGELIEGKCLQCPHCNQFVAMVIFAPHDTDQGRMEDYYRSMYPQIKQRNLPTWLIGPPLTTDPAHMLADTWQVWPQRQAIKRLSPDALNRQLDPLVNGHCQGQ